MLSFVDAYSRYVVHHELLTTMNGLSVSVGAATVIAGIIDHYNHRRLHSSLSYLRPVDYYRGDPTTLLAERRRRLQEARELRKQENLKLRQRLIPWRQEEHLYSTRPVVTL